MADNGSTDPTAAAPTPRPAPRQAPGMATWLSAAQLRARAHQGTTAPR